MIRCEDYLIKIAKDFQEFFYNSKRIQMGLKSNRIFHSTDVLPGVVDGTLS